MINRISIKIQPIVFRLVIILFWVGWAIFYSLHETVNIPTYHMDGAFQTSSGLYRLDAGQFPGKDFYPYLGVGPLYVLYPLFKALGSDVSSSIFSAYFTVAVVVLLSIAFIWHMIWRPKSFLSSMAAGSILFFLYIGFSIVNRLLFNQPVVIEQIGLSPGNSLRPLRSFAPYLAAIIFYFFVLNISSTRMKYIAAGMLTGLILLWSNDYAITTSFLFGILIISYALSRNELRLENMLVYVLLSVATWAILFTFATHGHPIELLKYNFLDVAQDQWWYFSPYSESERIFSVSQFAQLFIRGLNSVALIVMAILAFLAWKSKAFEFILLLWVGTALLSGGIVASVGGHYGILYFYALNYWSIMIIIVSCIRLIWARLTWRVTTYSYAPRIAAWLYMCIPLGTAFYLYQNELSTAKKDTNRFFVNELGGYLTKEWYDYVVLARNTPANQLVAEEYWGIWSALRKSFFIWPVDSVIHALGDTRNIARQKLEKADMVISTRISASSEWQPWSLSQNYWFYKNLLNEWSIYTLSPNTIVWKKSGIIKSPVMVECEPESTSASTHLLRVYVPTPGYYEMDVQYKKTDAKRALLLVQNNISFAEDADGYISIDPKSTEVRFPAYFNHEGQANLNVKTIGNEETTVVISLCTAKQIAFHDKEVLSPHPNNRLGIDK